MPKSNAYGGGNVSLRDLVNNGDYSRIRKFSKKLIEMKDSEYHLGLSKELWQYHSELPNDKKNIGNKKDAHDLSVVHFAISNTTENFWG